MRPDWTRFKRDGQTPKELELEACLAHDGIDA